MNQQLVRKALKEACIGESIVVIYFYISNDSRFSNSNFVAGTVMREPYEDKRYGGNVFDFLPQGGDRVWIIQTSEIYLVEEGFKPSFEESEFDYVPQDESFEMTQWRLWAVSEFVEKLQKQGKFF